MPCSEGASGVSGFPTAGASVRPSRFETCARLWPTSSEITIGRHHSSGDVASKLGTIQFVKVLLFRTNSELSGRCREDRCIPMGVVRCVYVFLFWECSRCVNYDYFPMLSVQTDVLSAPPTSKAPVSRRGNCSPWPHVIEVACLLAKLCVCVAPLQCATLEPSVMFLSPLRALFCSCRRSMISLHALPLAKNPLVKNPRPGLVSQAKQARK